MLTALAKDFRKKVVSSGGIAVFTGSLVSKFVSFFGTIVVVRILSKSDYGVLSYAENLYGYFYLLSGLGLVNAILRYVILQNEQSSKYGVVLFCVTAGTLFNVLLLASAYAFCLIYPHPAEYSSYLLVMLVMMTGIAFQFLLDCAFFTMRSLFDTKAYAGVTLAVSTTLILVRICGALICGVLGVASGVVAVEVISVIALAVLIKKKYFAKVKPRYPDSDLRADIISYSIKCIFSSGIWVVFTLNDVFLIGLLCSDPESIGAYKAASILPSFLSLISNSIGVVVGPYFTKKESEKAYGWMKRTYRAILLGSLAVFLVLGSVLFVLAEQIVVLVFGQNYIDAAQPMRFLVVAAVLNCALRYPSANILTSIGKVEMNLFSAVIGIMVQIAIGFYLIPSFGIIGAAFGNCIAYLIMSIILFTYFNVYLHRIGNER